MNTNHQHIDTELLFDYRQGLVSPEAANRITDHLKDCDECAGIAEGIKTWLQVHPNGSFEEFESFLNHSGDRVKEQVFKTAPNYEGAESGKIEKPAKNLNISIIRRIAALFLIGVLTVLAYNYMQKPDTDAIHLAAAYLETPYPSPPVSRSESEPENRLFEQAVTHYNAGDFETAGEFFERILQNDHSDYTSRFYLGLTMLYRDASNPEEAIASLQQLPETGHRYVEQSQWYLALAYFTADDLDNAKMTFNKILENRQHYRFSEAAELSALLMNEE